jgi:SAM-dependent methyltransferase
MTEPRPREYREFHRAVELEVVRDLFGQGQRVLDLGAGAGFLAALMTWWGCDVTAIDVKLPAQDAAHFDVRAYDGRIPYGDAEFDIVLGSHLLAHVDDLDFLLAEVRRVLKPAGAAVFIVPTTAWRFWTSVVHYPARFRRAGQLMKTPDAPTSPRRRSPARRLLNTALAPPLSVWSRTALHELFAFSRRAWVRRLGSRGFRVERIVPTRVFYTGNLLFRFLTVTRRKLLARLFGSATVVIVARP